MNTSVLSLYFVNNVMKCAYAQFCVLFYANTFLKSTMKSKIMYHTIYYKWKKKPSLHKKYNLLTST